MINSRIRKIEEIANRLEESNPAIADELRNEVELMDIEFPAENAIHQLTGFEHRSSGYGVISLVESMGLARFEWEMIKEEGTVSTFLSVEHINDIQQHFNAIGG